MMQFPGRLVALLVAVGLFAGCGTTVRPRISRGGTDQPTSMLPGSLPGPRPGPETAVDADAKPLVDQICRANGMRAGWIAIRYVEGDERCPESTDPGNRFTASVIERYDQKPVGTTMVVCADQAIPRQWARVANHETRATCDGARVRDGESTIMAIQRVSQRQ